jgi:hypothetical protein
MKNNGNIKKSRETEAYRCPYCRRILFFEIFPKLKNESLIILWCNCGEKNIPLSDFTNIFSIKYYAKCINILIINFLIVKIVEKIFFVKNILMNI